VIRRLAFMTFPSEHWDKISSTNPIERLNGEIKRRADVVGICAGFWTPAAAISPRARTAGVQKAPGHEVAVSRAGGWESSAMGISGWRRIRLRRDTGVTRPECLHVAAGEGVEEAFRQGLRGIEGALRTDCPELGREGSPRAWSQRKGTAKRRR
jgi:hypothetical protein